MKIKLRDAFNKPLYNFNFKEEAEDDEMEICAYQDECDGHAHAQAFCIEQICKWLESETER